MFKPGMLVRLDTKTVRWGNHLQQIYSITWLSDQYNFTERCISNTELGIFIMRLRRSHMRGFSNTGVVLFGDKLEFVDLETLEPVE